MPRSISDMLGYGEKTAEKVIPSSDYFGSGKTMASESDESIPRREELEALKMSVLMEKAKAAKASQQQIYDAIDAEDSKHAMVELILKQEAVPMKIATPPIVPPPGLGLETPFSPPGVFLSEKSSGGAAKNVTGHEKEIEQVSEEEWKKRIEKRKDAVNKLQITDPYTKNQEMFEDTACKDYRPKDQRPQTPDPTNREISKRVWETSVAAWRSKWREIDGVRKLMQNNPGVSEEKCQQAWSETKAAKNSGQSQDDQKPAGHSQEDHIEKAQLKLNDLKEV
jgi:hypothetical protein